MDRVPPGKRAQSLPMVLALTTLVLVVPCVAAFGLQSTGALGSPVLLVLVPVLISIVVSHLISEVWKRRRAGSPFVFDDLMLWGWIRQRRFDRLLSRYEELIGPSRGDGADPELRAKELERLAGAMEARDPRTHGHSRRVARHAASIARSLKLESEDVARIRTAALLHDLGKIEVPWSILEKPGGLTEDEFEVIKRHPEDGARLVRGLEDPELEAIVRHHHERIDGGGYPDGLEGESIPLGARIVAVADTFDALTSARSYRQPRSHEEALEVLRREAGSQLDADAVAAFNSRYSGRRPVALAAGMLGLLRQAGQSVISFGTGASQVAAVGATAVAISAAPAVEGNLQQTPDRPAAKQRVITGSEFAQNGADSSPVGNARPSGEPNPVRRSKGTNGSTGPSDQSRPGGNRPGSDGQAEGENPSGGGVEDTGDGGSVDSTGGETGATTGGGSGGSESGGGGGSQTVTQPVKKITETVTKPVQQITEQVTESVPTLPGNDPVSQGVNNTVSGVKDTVGKLIGKP